MLSPKHKENIIVGVVSSNKFNWYILPVTVALLDLSKLKSSTREYYLSHTSFKNIRQASQNLSSEKEVKEFMLSIKPFLVFSEQLSNMLAHASKGKGNFANDFCPAILYDFDKSKMLYSSEIFDVHARCLPNLWTAEKTNFLEIVPRKHQFWKLI